LQGLAREDVARLIEFTSGNTAHQGLVEAIHSQTEGNALFVTEIVRMLEQEGGLSTDAMSGPVQGEDRDSWTIRIPEGVREVIGRRLNRLSDHCNETLTVASVIGREFTLDQLRPLVEDFTEDQLLGVLEEALAGRAIEETSDTVGHYQFAHALIQETLISELSLTQRVRLHARIAETLETGYGLEAEDHAAELVYHFAQAQTVTGAEKVVQYSIVAGEKAVNVQAYDEALVHFQMGLTVKGVALTGSEPAED
jgi:predicted ATPase